MTKAACAPSTLDKTQGILSAAAFILLLAGTNAPTPLLPLYRDTLGFSSLAVTLTYSIYVTTLVVFLLFASHSMVVRRAPMMLLTSLLIAMLADWFLATGTQSGILTGRALAGASGGFGTGAAAALAVSAIGGRGRALSATGNLAGAIIGTTATQILLAIVGAKAISLSFEIHVVACAVVFIPLSWVLYRRKIQNGIAFQSRSTAPAPVRAILLDHRNALLTGCLAWITISCCIVFLPTYFADHAMGIVQAVGIPVLLSCSLIGQLASPSLKQNCSSLSGMGVTLLGLTCIFAGAALKTTLLGVSGFAMVGFGAGLAYRTSLVLLSLKASPLVQGRLTSLYAAITYAVAAVAILISGVATKVASFSSITWWVFGLTAIMILLTLPSAPRLKDLQ